MDAGHTATFNCTTYGHPVQEVTWFKDGQALTLTSRVSVVDDVRLVIREVGRTDQGMYQCLVNNDRDTAQGIAQLTLGGR